MLDDVTAALAAIQAGGSFAVERACPSDNLHIEVEGVGPLRFPITAAVAKKLRSVARPAPFGRRDQTLLDPAVRDTWEIGKDQITIDSRRWAPVLRAQLDALQEDLGLPAGCKLTARLDKMLVYEPGQFFAPHQDSERSRDMACSLVVELPSRSTGGAVVVQLGTEKVVLHGAPRHPTDLSLLAFYADCHHEVQPITSGFRVVLTYHLLRRDSPAPARADHAAEVERLAAAVKAFFATPVQQPYANQPAQPPDRLVYLLDHEYTEQSLGWERLKNADAPRAKALLDVADRLGCEVFLALADVQETWNCMESDDRGWGRRRRGWYEDDEDGEDENGSDEEYELLDLVDDNLELRHWLDRHGKDARGVPTIPADAEIRFTRPSSEMSPFRSEHEGYMGNYGNTVDRWYHRAAVVLWPRERNFVIRAKVAPAWAVKEVLALLRKGKVREARERAHSLLPFWSGVARQEGGERFTVDLLEAAGAFGEADLAHDLLAPLSPSRLTPAAVPGFVALVERLGAAWAQKLFSTWSSAALRRWDAAPWRPLLPGLCAALAAGAERHGRAFAEWLLAGEVRAFEKEHSGMLTLPPVAAGERSRAAHRRDLACLFVAAAVLGAASLREELIAFLTAGETALLPLEAGELLRELRGARTPAGTRALGLSALHRHAVDRLASALSIPPRRPDDWSIQVRLRCSCALCKELSAFLRAAHREEHRWPLAKDGRRHVHHQIDSHALPVTHVTERRGSPYTLVLRKQRALFDLDAAARERQKEMLAWLRKNRRAFSDPEQSGA